MLRAFRPSAVVAAIAVICIVASVIALERQRAGLSVDRAVLSGSPTTIWRPADAGASPLVVLAHGYGGSRQMMQAIAITLARSGLVVAAFDFHGHGRNRTPMDADVTSLAGATAQLVRQTVAVTRAARDLPGVGDPVALVGHSMATDIVIRASAEIEDVAAVVAISMYSDAVDPQFPQRLLIVSGAREERLRQVALDRLRQVDPAAEEGQTARSNGVERRAVSAPWAGHVGVLYSPTALTEIRDWIGAGLGGTLAGAPPATGIWLLMLLTALVALAWPLALQFGPPRPAPRVARRTALIAIVAPAPPALAVAVLLPDGALGLTAFGQLTAFFAVWGAVQFAILWRAGLRLGPLDPAGFLFMLAWGLGVFAIALDRYGAAFVPVGPRAPVMALLALGTLPFVFADALLARGSGIGVRLVARAAPIATLLGAMLLAPRLGVAFTVLPVMALFWIVYGLAGRWVAARTGATAAGAALGLILAWAIAASTPLIAA